MIRAPATPFFPESQRGLFTEGSYLWSCLATDLVRVISKWLLAAVLVKCQREDFPGPSGIQTPRFLSGWTEELIMRPAFVVLLNSLICFVVFLLDSASTSASYHAAPSFLCKFSTLIRVPVF